MSLQNSTLPGSPQPSWQLDIETQGDRRPLLGHRFLLIFRAQSCSPSPVVGQARGLVGFGDEVFVSERGVQCETHVARLGKLSTLTLYLKASVSEL